MVAGFQELHHPMQVLRHVECHGKDRTHTIDALTDTSSFSFHYFNVMLVNKSYICLMGVLDHCFRVAFIHRLP